MKHDFGKQTWLYPMPVFIIGTYDKDGKIDPAKFNPITYDSVNHNYIALGSVAGKAFDAGKALK